MSEDVPSAERRRNIWAPWRIEYIRGLDEGRGGCFLCDYVGRPAADADNLVLWRRASSFAVLNRFPYTGGHLLVAPYEHLAELADLDDRTVLEMVQLVCGAQAALRRAVHAQGFNVGLNVGRCAGAGLPGHLHVHVVPRWGGDTNFMAVLGDARVIPESLASLHARLREAGEALGLDPSAGADGP
jgi:ATP adenylyltransferase